MEFPFQINIPDGHDDFSRSVQLVSQLIEYSYRCPSISFTAKYLQSLSNKVMPRAIKLRVRFETHSRLWFQL